MGNDRVTLVNYYDSYGFHSRAGFSELPGHYHTVGHEYSRLGYETMKDEHINDVFSDCHLKLMSEYDAKGNTLGVIHNESGIKTPSSSDVNRNGNIFQREINTIIIGALRGTPFNDGGKLPGRGFLKYNNR